MAPDQDAIDLQREQAEAAAAAAKGEDAPGEEEGGASAVPGDDPSAFLGLGSPTSASRRKSRLNIYTEIAAQGRRIGNIMNTTKISRMCFFPQLFLVLFIEPAVFLTLPLPFVLLQLGWGGCRCASVCRCVHSAMVVEK